MAIYKVTFGFVRGVYGPTESYISKDVTGPQANALLNNLIESRNSLLHTSVTWTGVRVAKTPEAGKNFNDVANQSYWFPPGTYEGFGGNTPLVIPGSGVYTGAEEQDQPDQARSCMQVRFLFDNTRNCLRYISFVPDGLIRNETLGLNFAAYTVWTQRATFFRNRLVNDNWAIRARMKSAGYLVFPIETWVQSDVAPGWVGIQLAADPAPGFVLRDKVQIRGVKRRGTDGISYNAMYRVGGINATAVNGKVIYYLRNTEQADPASVKEPGTVQKVGYGYFPIQSTIPIRGGVHKRGKPLGGPTGRAAKLPPRLV